MKTPKHLAFNEGIASETTTLQEGYKAMKTGGYRVCLEIPNNRIEFGQSDRPDHTSIEINLPGMEELDLSSIRKQLETSYSANKVDDILEAIQEAVDAETIPIALRQYIVRK